MKPRPFPVALYVHYNNKVTIKQTMNGAQSNKIALEIFGRKPVSHEYQGGVGARVVGERAAGRRQDRPPRPGLSGHYLPAPAITLRQRHSNDTSRDFTTVFYIRERLQVLLYFTRFYLHGFKEANSLREPGSDANLICYRSGY